MNCNKCNNQIDEDSAFCEFCGEQILVIPKTQQNDSLNNFQNRKVPRNTDKPSKNVFAYIQKRGILRNILILVIIFFWITAITEEDDFLQGTFEAMIITSVALIVFDTIIKYRHKKLSSKELTIKKF